MTSGTFSSIPLDTITILPDRQRKTLPDLSELAASIATVGLINPIVVDEETMTLVAGECRMTACRDILGWTHINVQYTRDLDPRELHLIELEENVKRVTLPWRDQCEAVAKYHDLCSSVDDEWTGAQTATALGISPNEVSSRRAVHKAIEAGEPLVCGADKYSVARGIVQRQAERAKESAIDSIDAMLTPPQIAPEAVSRTEEQEAHTTYVTSEPEPEEVQYIHNASFGDFASTYTGPKFNFLHCDFPYGIDAGKHNQGAADKFGGYEDGEDVYFDLLNELDKAMDTLIADSAHMLFWYSMNFHSETVERLTNMGWTVNPFPLIWHRNDNSGIMPDPQRGGRRVYETALHCTRGDRKVVKPVSMLTANPNTKNIHMSEKPLPVLAHFFRMFVDKNTRMLDPTAGSGNAVAQALLMDAPLAVGVELDPTFHVEAVKNVDKIIGEG